MGNKMASVNKAIILGNLGSDPEVRKSQDGSRTIAQLSVATARRYKDANNELVTETEWHRVVLFGRTAEVAEQYLKKGNPVYIEGRLRTRKWQDQSGQDRYTTEIVGDQMQLLSAREQSHEEQPRPAASKPAAAARKPRAADTAIENVEEDVPF